MVFNSIPFHLNIKSPIESHASKRTRLHSPFHFLHNSFFCFPSFSICTIFTLLSFFTIDVVHAHFSQHVKHILITWDLVEVTMNENFCKNKGQRERETFKSIQMKCYSEKFIHTDFICKEALFINPFEIFSKVCSKQKACVVDDAWQTMLCTIFKCIPLLVAIVEKYVCSFFIHNFKSICVRIRRVCVCVCMCVYVCF